MRSAAHEAIASGDLALACVGASRSAPVMDALLATFVAGRGIWVTRDQRSVDLHIFPVAGITAASLRLVASARRMVPASAARRRAPREAALTS